MINILTALLLLCGGGFAAVAALGIVRLPDTFMRMHASTKAGTLGAGLIMVAVAIHTPDTGVALRALLTILFILLTAPVSAHIVGRTAYLVGTRMWRRTWRDDLKQACPPVAPADDRQGAAPETCPPQEIDKDPRHDL